MNPSNLDSIKQIPILEVATRLGIEVIGKSAMCFDGHDNKTRSLTFSPTKNLWNCFGCGKGGDNIQLVQEALEINFSTALVWFAEEFNVDVRHANGTPTKKQFRKHVFPLNKLTERNDTTPKEFDVDSEVYKWVIENCGAVTQDIGIQYLKSHGITTDVAKSFEVRELRDPHRAFQRLINHWGAERVYRSGLVWGQNGKPDRLIWTSYALLFPFYHDCELEYIQGRMFGGKSKFLNPRGIQKPLYNIDCLSTQGRSSVVHVCEGVPDVLALHSKGLTAVAVLGASSFRPEWIDLFFGFDVVVLPDGDDGGKVFADKINHYFSLRGQSVHVVFPPDGMDVSDVIAKMDDSK